MLTLRLSRLYRSAFVLFPFAKPMVAALSLGTFGLLFCCEPQTNGVVVDTRLVFTFAFAFSVPSFVFINGICWLCAFAFCCAFCVWFAQVCHTHTLLVNCIPSILCVRCTLQDVLPFFFCLHTRDRRWTVYVLLARFTFSCTILTLYVVFRISARCLRSGSLVVCVAFVFGVRTFVVGFCLRCCLSSLVCAFAMRLLCCCLPTPFLYTTILPFTFFGLFSFWFVYAALPWHEQTSLRCWTLTAKCTTYDTYLPLPSLVHWFCYVSRLPRHAVCAFPLRFAFRFCFDLFWLLGTLCWAFILRLICTFGCSFLFTAFCVFVSFCVLRFGYAARFSFISMPATAMSLSSQSFPLVVSYS